jgi:uncharacterized phage protein (TIGR01671 family)
MREIKFRAYEPKNQIMFFYDERDGRETMNFYFDGGIAKAQVIIGPEDGDAFGYEYFPCEIMQSTGLKDKNGKEIYEGDVLIPFTKSIGPYWIVFENGAFVCYHKHGRWGLLSRAFEIGNPLGYSPEVIGNIHENPELLNQKL